MKLKATHRDVSKRGSEASNDRQSGVQRLPQHIFSSAGQRSSDQGEASEEERTKKFHVPEELLRLAGKGAGGPNTTPPGRLSPREKQVRRAEPVKEDSGGGSVLLAYLEEDERRAAFEQ